jgi:hypothetical protein
MDAKVPAWETVLYAENLQYRCGIGMNRFNKNGVDHCERGTVQMPQPSRKNNFGR